MNQASFFCPQCREPRLFQQKPINHVAHLLASVFLCGLWLPIWAMIALTYDEPWHCSRCGFSDGLGYLQDPHRRGREAEARRRRAEIKANAPPASTLSTSQKAAVFAVCCILAAGAIVFISHLSAAPGREPAVSNAVANRQFTSNPEDQLRESLISRIRAAYDDRFLDLRIVASGDRLFMTTGKADRFVKEFQKSLYFKEAPDSGFASVQIKGGKTDWVHEFKTR